ncbi:MAG TPA: hypothetical protein GX507_08605 [Clostridia bacterium]|nr:hypothetical protein [Clostridia bacterium]
MAIGSVRLGTHFSREDHAEGRLQTQNGEAEAVSDAFPNPITDWTLRLIHDRSRGIPRLINNVCVSCLIDLKARGGNVVEEDNVKKAFFFEMNDF